VPADFQTIYNLNPLYRQGINGKGQTITVVESSATYSTDVATYRSTFLSGWYGHRDNLESERQLRLHQCH
jgi:hypothetical protein